MMTFLSTHENESMQNFSRTLMYGSIDFDYGKGKDMMFITNVYS